MVILFFALLGANTGKGVQNEDYCLAGRKCSAISVSGILLGALVGGASTVGTVQMAYSYGLSAWWFTLGGGIGCLVLGLFFAAPLRASGLQTITQFLAEKYGSKTAKVSMWASVIGTFISVIAQFLAGAALLKGIVPINDWAIMLIFSLAILAFIFLGGLKSYSKIGVYKIVFLYGILFLCFIVSLRELGWDYLKVTKNLPSKPFFSLFGLGVGKGLSAGTSLVVGVLCTQIYIQAVFSSSSPKTAKNGALLAAFLMPPLGLLGIWIGLYLRSSGVDISPSEALSFFIHNHFPPFLAGAIWAGILITVIGTAAGLALGMATNLVSDFLIPARRQGANALWLNRLMILVVIFGAAAIAALGKASMILEWSYLSMGLRGAGTFFPLVIGILKPGLLPPRWAFWSSSLGLSTTLFWPLTGLPLKPLFAGLGASALASMIGLFMNSIKKG